MSFPNVGTLGGNFIRRFRLFVKEAGFLWLTALLRPGFQCYLISPMFRRVEEADSSFTQLVLIVIIRFTEIRHAEEADYYTGSARQIRSYFKTLF